MESVNRRVTPRVARHTSIHKNQPLKLIDPIRPTLAIAWMGLLRLP